MMTLSFVIYIAAKVSIRWVSYNASVALLKMRDRTRRRTATTSKLKRSPSLFFEINANREISNYAV